jgi:hypothetical protein
MGWSGRCGASAEAGSGLELGQRGRRRGRLDGTRGQGRSGPELGNRIRAAGGSGLEVDTAESVPEWTGVGPGEERGSPQRGSGVLELAIADRAPCKPQEREPDECVGERATSRSRQAPIAGSGEGAGARRERRGRRSAPGVPERRVPSARHTPSGEDEVRTRSRSRCRRLGTDRAARKASAV